MTITVSTDGSALGNPNGPMGWAWADHASNAAHTPGHQHDGDSDAGGATNGTNQIGELCAVLEALRAHTGAEPLTIETDSQYAINCSTKWVRGWKKNGWKNSQKKPVKNAPLIKAIDAEISKREGPVKFVWVKGHNGNPGNEKVDDLAHTYSGDARSGVKEGYLPLEGWQSLLASEYSKGTDVPADAQMLIDGKITGEQYHLGRGERTDDGKTEDSDSIAHQLAEPEGVPDYDFGNGANPEGKTAQATSKDRGKHSTDQMADEGESENEHRSNRDTTAAGNDADLDNATDRSDIPESPVPSNASDTVRTTDMDTTAALDGSDTTDVSGISGTSDVTASPVAFDHSETQDIAGTEDAGSQTENDNEEDPIHDIEGESGTQDDHEQSDGSDTENSDATETTTNKAASQEQAVPRLTRSGLTASGTLRITPPPSSSPTYDGHPRFVKGAIAVEGYVEGDGTLRIENAQFLMKPAHTS